MDTIAAALWSLVVTENGYFHSPKLKNKHIEWKIINVVSEQIKGYFPQFVSLLKQFLRTLSKLFQSKRITCSNFSENCFKSDINLGKYFLALRGTDGDSLERGDKKIVFRVTIPFFPALWIFSKINFIFKTD